MRAAMEPGIGELREDRATLGPDCFPGCQRPVFGDCSPGLRLQVTRLSRPMKQLKLLELLFEREGLLARAVGGKNRRSMFCGFRLARHGLVQSREAGGGFARPAR